MRRIAAIVALAAGAALLGPAPQARAVEWPDWVQRLSTYPAALAESAGGAVDAVWNGAASLLLPESPFDYLPERLSEADLAFVAMMESAGLTFAEIRTGGGLLPDATYRFVASREPSAVDLERVRRQLAQHRTRHGGLRAIAQQRIMQTVLDTATGGSFVIVDLEVSVRPWPSIRYLLSNRARPLDPPQRRLFEALGEHTTAGN
jgi:hypothetical protein